MKKKLLFGFILMVLLLGTILTACTTDTVTPSDDGVVDLPEKDTIVVGMARSLSGPLAMIGDSAFRPIYEKWIDVVNADGGIYVEEYGKKLPVEFLIYDDKSDVSTMTRLVEKLIVEDKVDFLFGPVGTAPLFAAAPIANKYQKILLSAEGGASSIIPVMSAVPYLFVGLSFSNWYQLPVLGEILAEQGAKSCYIMYIADLHGVEYSSEATLEFPKHGIEILAAKSVPPDIKDVSPILKDAKASGADAFMSFCYPDQNILATAQSMELDYNPKAFVTGPGANFGFWYDIFGPATEGVTCFAVANRKTGPEMKAMYDMLYPTKEAESLSDWWGHPEYWASLQAWEGAIEQAGTLDNTVVRDVLASGTFDTVMGPLQFRNGLMTKESHTGEVGQWQNGMIEIVGPSDTSAYPNMVVTAPYIYPKPAWPK